MPFTKEQQEAITRRGSNIIVSAGAGSGKTAVLSERILSFCKEGNDIRRVLVLTFTEKAAQEMKERIRQKLLDNNLDLQAEYIDSAYITTFDSYSLSMVRKYYYLLGLKKGVSIMDGALIEIKKREIIREIFTENYLNKNEKFYDYLRKYSLQDDKDVLNTIALMTKDLELIVDLDSFIKTYEATYFNPNKIKEITDKYEEYARENVKEFITLLTDLKDEALKDKDSQNLATYLDNYLSHLHSEDSYEILKQEISGYSLPRLTKASPFVKEKRDALKPILEELTKKVFAKYNTKSEMEEELFSVKDDVLFLLSLCKETLDRLFLYKKEHNMFGFNDIAKLLIKLVKENDFVKEELKNSYDEILVDEYQDTSDIQEAFLSLIENNNRYMVGDIKQSIYRFRNANPYIFKEKYDSYSKEKGGHKIDLTYNFRSRDEVLADINLLFNKLMTNEIGDASYKESHQMQFGLKDYLKLEEKFDFHSEVLMYSLDEDSLFTQAENEAFIIAKDIKERIKSKVKVLKKGGFKEVTYNDFAILIANATEFVTFKQIFEYLNIPLSIEASLDLKDSILPVLYKNILKALSLMKKNVKNEAFYHAVASLARSFIYEYSDEDIYDLCYNKKAYPIYDDLKLLIETDEISYSSLFYKIDNVINIYSKLAKIGDVDSSLVVLDYVHQIFKLFDDLGYDLEEAASYMEVLLESDLKVEYKPSVSHKDAVRIMTIHKSKGLEFPFCYFPLLNHGFNQADMRKSIGLSKEYGIFIPYADEGKSKTVIQTLYSLEVKEKDISEKVRLLYVALTRAREKMILLLPKKEFNKISPKNYKSFAEMLVYTGDFLQFKKDIDLKDYDITDYKRELYKPISLNGKEVLKYEKRILPELKEKTRISKELKVIPDKSLEESILLGLKFHSALESLDFKNPNISNLPIDDFMKDTLISLLDNPIFKNIKNAKTYHENEFYFSYLNEDYHGIIDLLVEYDDHFDIIDYKLSSVDSKEYERQLSIYKMYVASKTNKPINTYLLSILKREIKRIDV